MTNPSPMQVPAKDQPLQCRCGQLKGAIARAARLTRVSCYCRDCQAYAHALGNPETVLDDLGGTDIVASLQQHVTLTGNTEVLACLSLSKRGLLRWYAGCCNTPIANTTRDFRLSYVGLVHTCLGQSSSALDVAFGPERIAVNTKHAKARVASSRLRTITSMLSIFASVARARIDGTYRKSPFFNTANGNPVVVPRILSASERERARNS